MTTAPDRRAFELAMTLLELHEPKDSRAVSDEFVAIAAAYSGDYSPEVMKVIDTALERLRQ